MTTRRGITVVAELGIRISWSRTNFVVLDFRGNRVGEAWPSSTSIVVHFIPQRGEQKVSRRLRTILKRRIRWSIVHPTPFPTSLPRSLSLNFPQPVACTGKVVESTGSFFSDDSSCARNPSLFFFLETSWLTKSCSGFRDCHLQKKKKNRNLIEVPWFFFSLSVIWLVNSQRAICIPRMRTREGGRRLARCSFTRCCTVPDSGMICGVVLTADTPRSTEVCSYAEMSANQVWLA